eukprot:gnl/TRDRNA2_/TRDRNA2_37531_c0_seq1.p2 gnl/TRDRNA2_/TRDRNA2_37531_c0~~gnl/TRDRNA2_/TRDRNA2_37531_c0_seq1.p2  ORF type:complete len:206 (-),score=65.06 gnl/TRDRNA2_/TRDRNA2_37531_c0_seq1:151-768(-)
MRLPLLLAAALLEAARGEWNDGQVGRSKYYDELELDNFRKKVFLPDKDVVVAIYGDGCDVCQQLHDAHEKAAEKTLKKTSKVKFTRYDERREGGQHVTENKLPEFHEDPYQLPRMYFVRAGSTKPKRIPHGDMGWGKGAQGAKKLFAWIKEHSTADEFKKKAKGSTEDKEQAATEEQEKAAQGDEAAADEKEKKVKVKTKTKKEL